MRRLALRLLVTACLVAVAAAVSCGVSVGAWLLSSLASTETFQAGFVLTAAAVVVVLALLPRRDRER